jgi:endonuclease YncB( thermonuclease family)
MYQNHVNLPSRLALLTAMILLVMASLVLPPMAPALADDAPFMLSGEVMVTKVSDGDSLRSGRLKIRLHGIDAPELKQTCRAADGKPWPCGQASQLALAAMVTAPLQCELRDVDRYGRLVMRCLAGGNDIAERLVSQGLAMAYRRYSSDYVAAEEDAAADARGIWQGRFEPPWDWRRKN